MEGDIEYQSRTFRSATSSEAKGRFRNPRDLLTFPDLSKAVNSKELFLRILETDELPNDPEEMKESYVLPASVLGDTDEMIENGQNEMIEYSQNIVFDSKNMEAKSLPPLKGHGYKRIPFTNGSVAFVSMRQALQHVPKSFFGKKALNFVHTHPTVYDWQFQEGSWLPGAEDVGVFKFFPRYAHMFTIGSVNYHNNPYEKRAIVLMQTKKTATLPLTMAPYKFYPKYLRRKGYDNSKKLMPMSDQIEILEDIGYGVYGWKSGGVLKGNLVKGAEFVRVSQNLDIFSHSH